LLGPRLDGPAVRRRTRPGLPTPTPTPVAISATAEDEYQDDDEDDQTGVAHGFSELSDAVDDDIVLERVLVAG
jgi:hypothetical protein